jgi:hypothetical protein
MEAKAITHEAADATQRFVSRNYLSKTIGQDVRVINTAILLGALRPDGIVGENPIFLESRMAEIQEALNRPLELVLKT